MEQRKQTSPLVLKYGKRRFDGGTEVELIRTIERQKTMLELRRLQEQHLEEVKTDLAKPSAQANLTPPAAEPAKEPAPVARKNRVLEAWILGPMELCVGAVGLLTATLAVITFRQLNNEPLLKQSQGVFNDCLGTFRKGIIDTLTTPIRVLKALAPAA